MGLKKIDNPDKFFLLIFNSYYVYYVLKLYLSM